MLSTGRESKHFVPGLPGKPQLATFGDAENSGAVCLLRCVTLPMPSKRAPCANGYIKLNGPGYLETYLVDPTTREEQTSLEAK